MTIKVFDPMRAIFDMLMKRVNEAVTLEHGEVAGLCRALAIIADPGAIDEEDVTRKLRDVCRATFDDILNGTGVQDGIYTRDLFLRHAATRGLGSIFDRFAERPRQT